MSGDVLEELVSEGWPVAAKQLSDFFGGSASSQDINKLKKYLLDADMRDFAFPALVDRINRQLGEFKGPLVVQIVKLRNVSYPKCSEKSHADGLIKIHLSDGFSNIQALQVEPIAELNAETPPGTKLRLVGKIPIENGLLLINEKNCRVLGGVVEKFVEKWNLEKNWLQKPVRSVESNAPRWIQFSKQRPLQSLPENAANKMFLANDVINGLSKTTVDERGDEFNVARKAQIEQVVENSVVKKFARSQLRLKSSENVASIPPSSNDKKDFGVKSKVMTETNRNRRFGRDDKKILSPVRRPSNPPTIFDFVQSKVSISNGPSQQDSVPLSSEQEKYGMIERNTEHQGMDRLRRSKFTDRGTAHRNQQMYNNANGSRTLEIFNSNRYRRQCSFRTDRNNECNYAANTVVDKFRSNYAEDYPSIAAVNNGLAEMHLSPSGSRQQDVLRTYNSTQLTGTFSTENSPHVYQQNKPEQQLAENTMMNCTPIWKAGDKCLAPWSDGQFYSSTVVSVGPVDMCTVEYDGYGNRSTVPIGVLLVNQTF